MAQDSSNLSDLSVCQEHVQVFLSEQLLYGLWEQTPLNVKIIHVYKHKWELLSSGLD